jgi:hypothetical protein
MVKESDKMDLPGRELPKEYREVAEELVSNQGWRYNDGGGRGGHPMLFPADPSKRPISISTTPGGDKRRGFMNWLSQVRQAGGIWPIERRK